MTEELKKIKQILPKGCIYSLAEEFSVTPATVWNTLNGKNKRFDIIKRVIEMARESLAVQKELRKTAKAFEDLNK
jgi:predicted transcriptional regulator